MTRPTQALIRLQSIRDNYALAKQHSEKAFAVIKADAYGHGVIAIANALADADGFAVACVDEALKLRDAGHDNELLVLEGGYDSQEWQSAVEHNLIMVLHHPNQIEQIKACPCHENLRLWLKLDTGMNRIGFRAEQYQQCLQQLADLTLVPETMMTHFACADEQSSQMTEQQLQVFQQCVTTGTTSLRNSAGILNWPTIKDQISRPGIMLYGGNPNGFEAGDNHNLKPAMTLQSELIAVRPVKAGESVGYGQRWVAQQDTLIGTVAIGYGDGYPRQAPSGTPVWIDGKRYPLAGRVSMDMLAVDLGPDSELTVGTTVELWGEHISADEIAKQCDTISYELFCQLTPRVPRKYLD
jgi:alanine racemase